MCQRTCTCITTKSEFRMRIPNIRVRVNQYQFQSGGQKPVNGYPYIIYINRSNHEIRMLKHKPAKGKLLLVSRLHSLTFHSLNTLQFSIFTESLTATVA